MSITTTITQLLKIDHPILLAGMGQTSGAELAAAVCNAGGLGVIGGVGYTPKQLKNMISELKSLLKDPSAPFGVDLLLPQVGGSARATNHDYTKGSLMGLIDVIIEGGATLFVSAVGVPPPAVIKRLHDAGVLYMNMVGHPKHAKKACEAGADIICAQGGEAGGHTGKIPFSVLIPAVADVCKKYKSPLTGKEVLVVAGGGVFDGRSLAAALMLGASAVWVGTRFVPTKESGAAESAKKSIVASDFDSNIKTTIYTGRPMRGFATPYVIEWETSRRQEQEALLAKGILPLEHELDHLHEQAGKGGPEGKAAEAKIEMIEDQTQFRPMGVVAGLVNELNRPAGEVVKEMSREAYKLLVGARGFVADNRAGGSRL